MWNWNRDAFPYTNFHELNLDYILRIAKYIKQVAAEMQEWRKKHEKEYEELKDHVDAIQSWIDSVESGDIPQALFDGLATWIDENLQELIGRAIKFVWFGLTSDGHFVAYIPESWHELTFDTCMDFDAQSYGHLLICYDDARLQNAETYHGSHMNCCHGGGGDLDNYWSKDELKPFGVV